MKFSDKPTYDTSFESSRKALSNDHIYQTETLLLKNAKSLKLYPEIWYVNEKFSVLVLEQFLFFYSIHTNSCFYQKLLYI